MSGPKLALLVLIALAILFAGGIGLGLRGGNQGSINTDWIDSIGAALSPRFDFDMLKGACVDQQANSFVIQPGASCIISIAAVKSGTRKLALRLTSGNEVTGTYVAPPGHEKLEGDTEDRSGSQDIKLEPEKTLSVVVLKEGGTLSLSCDKKEKTPCRIGAR